MNTFKIENTQFIEMKSDIPNFGQLPQLALEKNLEYRFYRINEISESNASQYRMAMANVIAGLSDNHSAIVYLLSGSPSGIDLYIGVASNEQYTDDEAEMLRCAFEGNFFGADLYKLKEGSDTIILENIFKTTRYLGLITGVPSFNDEENNLDGKDYQGIEILVNTLIDARWQMVIVAEAGSDANIKTSLEEIYELSTHLSEQIKHSVQQSENRGSSKTETKGSSTSITHGTNTGKSEAQSKGISKGVNKTESSGKSGSDWNKNTTTGTNDGSSEQNTITTNTGNSESTQTGNNYSIAEGTTNGESLSVTRERINKRNEQMQTHLNDTQIGRFMQGRSKGMYRAAIYICAENKAIYNRLSRSVLSIFQGSQPSYTPLNVHHMPIYNGVKLSDLLQLRHVEAKAFLNEQPESVILHSIPKSVHPNHIYAATWLTTRELALLAGLPNVELPGLKLRKSVSFALNTLEAQSHGHTINLGNIIQNGRELKHKNIEIPHDILNKHIFVTGVTGSGKTTTCMKLLLETGFPFTVIEPAKTEYRALYAQDKNQEIEYYALGREDLSTFRLNPFELVSANQNLMGHISMLKATMCAVFPMEASMPFIVEQAIIEAYQEKGWDISNNVNYLIDNPWDKTSDAWPTFSTMINKLDDVIKSAGMGKEFEEKYKGSLVSRLTSLTNGIKGTMINTPRSIDFNQLLDKKVVIELEELKDEEDKAFFMGLIIARFAECMKQRHKQNPDFKHITLVEEAHRLLSQPEPGADGSKKLGVEMFANLLAEVRKYGECLIIADQIPNKLVSDVIKNTNTKIVHRLFAADDRNAIGDAMGLNDEQKDFLPMLKAGETIIYSGGWHAAVRAKILQYTNTTAPEISEDLIKQQGIKQLWEQRKALLPRFSQHTELNQENFYSIFQAAREQLNLLIVMQSRHPDGNNKGGASTNVEELPLYLLKMSAKLTQSVRTTQQQWEFSHEKWAAILGDLMMDTDASSLSKQCIKDMQQGLLTLLTLAHEAQSPQFFLEKIKFGLAKHTFFKFFLNKHTI